MIFVSFTHRNLKLIKEYTIWIGCKMLLSGEFYPFSRLCYVKFVISDNNINYKIKMPSKQEIIKCCRCTYPIPDLTDDWRFKGLECINCVGSHHQMCQPKSCQRPNRYFTNIYKYLKKCDCGTQQHPHKRDSWLSLVLVWDRKIKK